MTTISKFVDEKKAMYARAEFNWYEYQALADIAEELKLNTQATEIRKAAAVRRREEQNDG